MRHAPPPRNLLVDWSPSTNGCVYDPALPPARYGPYWRHYSRNKYSPVTATGSSVAAGSVNHNREVGSALQEMVCRSLKVLSPSIRYSVNSQADGSASAALDILRRRATSSEASINFTAEVKFFTGEETSGTLSRWCCVAAGQSASARQQRVGDRQTNDVTCIICMLLHN